MGDGVVLEKNLETKVSEYEYDKTVFVYEDIDAYLVELEAYFRKSASSFPDSIYKAESQLDGLEREIEWYKRYGLFSDFWGEPQTGVRPPFSIDETNYNDGVTWFKDHIKLLKDVFNLQNKNRSQVQSIIEGDTDIRLLGLTNFGYRNFVVRIQYDDTQDPSIRMRVFKKEGINPTIYGKDAAQSFAGYANHQEGVRTDIRREADVDDIIKNPEFYLKASKTRRSKLRVKLLESGYQDKGDQLQYTLNLNEGEVEMLKGFDMERSSISTSNQARSICYKSPMWSPKQGWKLMRNLYGVVGIFEEDHGSNGGNRYILFLPGSNIAPIKRAVSNEGHFTKTVNKESLTALSALFDRTIELKQKYGWDFYPRFTVKEVSDRSGLSKEDSEKYLRDLTGVLCGVLKPFSVSKPYGDDQEYDLSVWVPKWFLPKTGVSLAYNMLKSEGFSVKGD